MGIRPETEESFTETLIQYARACGWLVAHFRPAKDRGGKWRTAMSGDPGFPDLVLTRNGVVLFVELKVGRNEATPAQERWLNALRETGAAAGVWRPTDWQTIQETLK